MEPFIKEVIFLENEAGINESEIRSFAAEILAYQRDLRIILNQYYDKIDNTKIYFKGEAADSYRKKFKDFSNNFVVVNKCFQSYNNDFQDLIHSYSNIEKNITIDE